MLASSNIIFFIICIEKYRHFRNILSERVTMTDNFIKNTANSFFTMLRDTEFLMITTEMYDL
jgi:hypothetical protein